MTKRVLLIGAGAVGQAYGYHFQRGGAEVGYFVREAYADEARAGFDLYPMNRRTPRAAPQRFDGFGVFSDMPTALNESWDVVVICLSSTALRKGNWLDELAAGIGDATLVNLTPGAEDYAYICERFAPEQVVSGLIGLLSYPGPLPGETLPAPGMVYWVPPMTKMTFSGPRTRTAEIVDALNKGGLRSKAVDSVHVQMAFGAPMLQFHMVALEVSGWSFKTMQADRDLMRLTHGAIKQAHALAATRHGVSIPLSMRLFRPWMVGVVTRLLPLVAPVDVESFFRKHFLKVGDQTEFGIRTLIDLAKAEQLSTDAIEELLERLLKVRGAPSARAAGLAKAS